MEIKRVGVVGWGLMGGGIAQVCAQSGYKVVVLEINEALLNRGLEAIDRVLCKDIDKGKLSQQDKDATMSRIKRATNTKDFCDCDFMIEAATENLDIKKKIFADVDKICPEHAILATNTSVLSVIDMAIVTNRPDKVLGMHFMNPVPIMKLIELVQTIATSADTLEVPKGFCESLGKTAIIAKDSPGFIANRLSTPFLLNAVRMVEASIATKEDIDTAARLGLNHPMGLLALLDLIGIDTFYSRVEAIYEELKDPQYCPPVLMKKMVAAGWLRRKTGKGFYEYK